MDISNDNRVGIPLDIFVVLDRASSDPTRSRRPLMAFTNQSHADLFMVMWGQRGEGTTLDCVQLRLDYMAPLPCPIGTAPFKVTVTGGPDSVASEWLEDPAEWLDASKAEEILDYGTTLVLRVAARNGEEAEIIAMRRWRELAAQGEVRPIEDSEAAS